MNGPLYRLCYLIAMIGAYSSCSEKKENIVHLHDLVDYNPDQTDISHEQTEQDTIFTPNFLPDELEKVAIVWDTVYKDPAYTFLHRFSPHTVEQFTYTINNAIVHYKRWNFSDSTKTMNAFLNWLACYGRACETIHLYEKKEIQTNPFLILQNNTTIIYIETLTRNLELEKWKQFYVYQKDDTWNTIITQKKQEPALWTSFKNKEEETLER